MEHFESGAKEAKQLAKVKNSAKPGRSGKKGSLEKDLIIVVLVSSRISRFHGISLSVNFYDLEI